MTSKSDVMTKGIAVILAAGRSRRFGKIDKRLACLPNGSTMLATVYAQAIDAFEDVIVVLRQGETSTDLNLPETACIFHAIHADDGMGASLADVFSELCCDAHYQQYDFAAVLLGDMPFIKYSTLETLKSFAQINKIVRPFYNHQMGHPVLFGKKFWAELKMLKGEDGAKCVIDSHLCCFEKVSISDNGIIYDVDTQETLTLLIE